MAAQARYQLQGACCKAITSPNKAMPDLLCGLHHPIPTPLDLPLGYWSHTPVFLRLGGIESASCAQSRAMSQ